MSLINSTLGTAGTYGTTSTGTEPPAGTVVYTSSSPTIQGIPSDALELGIKSLASGMTVSRQVILNKGMSLPENFSTKFNSTSTTMFKTGRNSAIVSGLVSAARNSYDFIQGNISGSRVGGNITADIVGGLGGGLAAAGVGSLATSAITSGVSGGIVGLLVGAATFIGADILYRKTGAQQFISDKVTGFIDMLLNRQAPPGGW